MGIDDDIIKYRLKYKRYWRNRSDWYWFFRTSQEFLELFMSLLGIHKDSPEWELRQIAAICINWLEKRSENVKRS